MVQQEIKMSIRSCRLHVKYFFWINQDVQEDWNHQFTYIRAKLCSALYRKYGHPIKSFDKIFNATLSLSLTISHREVLPLHTLILSLYDVTERIFHFIVFATQLPIYFYGNHTPYEGCTVNLCCNFILLCHFVWHGARIMSRGKIEG